MNDHRHMRRALDLAAHGQGAVEPNPMVGCVLVRDGEVIGEGWHREYGGPHAEVDALNSVAGSSQGATAYVTLEPCCHTGKTPPCSRALIDAQVSRVVVAAGDPFPAVDGGGVEQLRQAGIEVDCGLLADQSRSLNAPYFKLVETGRPWVIAKWAMTLDGKIAAASGDSHWISNKRSRAVVHQLRGRMDAILVGSKTAIHDDPLLTARPPGPRVATRCVFDSLATLPADCRLARTSAEIPVIVFVGPAAPADRMASLDQAGCEVFRCESTDRARRIIQALDELGRRRMTNLLVEGGGGLLGGLFDAGHIDEVHCFVAAKLLGGQQAPTPIAGVGLPAMSDALPLRSRQIELLDGDVYLHGRVQHS
jgi:diaminohydroxyphosphoribosylaminopyrimidine deaminase/5-amino-6-(5-phosphoribosylamino)uracil reductase